MMYFRNLVIFRNARKWPIALWKLFYRGNACKSLYSQMILWIFESQLISLKLDTSIVYDMLHMLWKFESNNYIESWDIKGCINGGTFENFINFGSFSVHLQTGITQCNMYVRVSYWCHRKAHGLVSYFFKYKLPRINSRIIIDTLVIHVWRCTEKEPKLMKF